MEMYKKKEEGNISLEKKYEKLKKREK